MATDVDYGSLYALQTSTTTHDSGTGSTGEAIDQRFHVYPESVTASPLERDVYSDESESGKSSNVSEAADVLIRSRWAKSFAMPVDNANFRHFMYYTLHGSAASSAAQIGATGVYEHHWTGPAPLGTVKPFDMEDCGAPAVDDSTQNFRVQNVVPVRTEATFAGLESRLTTDLINSGEVAGISGAAPTALSHTREKVFLPNHLFVYMSQTTGFLEGVYDIGGTTIFNAARATATAQARTELSGSVIDFTSYVESVTIRGINNIDLDASYDSSSVDADGAMVVADQSFIRTGEGQQCEVDVTLKTGAAAVTTLRAEFEDHTPRGIEVWAWTPSVITSGAYGGFRFTLGQAKPMSAFVQNSNGLGHKTVTLTYRAQYDTTAGYAWKFADTISDVTTIGS